MQPIEPGTVCQIVVDPLMDHGVLATQWRGSYVAVEVELLEVDLAGPSVGYYHVVLDPVGVRDDYHGLTLEVVASIVPELLSLPQRHARDVEHGFFAPLADDG